MNDIITHVSISLPRLFATAAREDQYYSLDEYIKELAIIEYKHQHNKSPENAFGVSYDIESWKCILGQNLTCIISIQWSTS